MVVVLCVLAVLVLIVLCPHEGVGQCGSGDGWVGDLVEQGVDVACGVWREEALSGDGTTAHHPVPRLTMTRKH